MCGIAGEVTRAPGVVPDEAVVRRMTRRLWHRGPDGEGYHCAEGVGLGMRRLSIIDIATGQQPIHNEDGTVWVVFNGEIYNFATVRARLEQAGHRFSTRSDTEVIVHAYEEYGDDFASALSGMFAIALWDARRRRLLLVRDRLGKKPLLYADLGERLVFASEPASLIAHPAVPRDVDHAGVLGFLAYQAVPAPRTGFAAIRKLEPGHRLVWDRNGIRQERYWTLRFEPKTFVDMSAAAAAVRETLHEAVRARLVSEVPLGAFLSGGIDSSAVVGLMAQINGSAVKTFSIGFDDSDFDELAYARLVAKRFHTDHHEFIVKPAAVEVLPTLVRHFGEPFSDASAVPTYHLSRLAREHVTVALCGDGGDELFSGYERYRKVLGLEPFARLLGPFVPSAVVGSDTLAAWYGMGRAARVRRRLTDLRLPLLERYRRWVTVAGPGVRAALCTPDFLRNAVADDPFAAAMDAAHGLAPVDALLAVDTATYLPNDLLAKVDVTSMASSLEVRSPFLAHELVELAAALPAALKGGARASKVVLRNALADLVPTEILTRPKMGFAIPVARWLREDLREMVGDVLLAPRATARGYFRPAAVAQLVEDHQRGTANYAGLLWALLMLELWHQIVVDESVAPSS
jgi:asparagine synthase (glutamine-hydrolysing)